MKRLFFFLFIAAALFALPNRAAAQHPEKSAKADLHVSQTLVVGGVTLKTGDYKFECKHVDGKQMLVVTDIDSGKEVARVPCTPENLAAKARENQFRSRPGFDGVPELTAVQIKGETVVHRVITVPAL